MTPTRPAQTRRILPHLAVHRHKDGSLWLADEQRGEVELIPIVTPQMVKIAEAALAGGSEGTVGARMAAGSA